MVYERDGGAPTEDPRARGARGDHPRQSDGKDLNYIDINEIECRGNVIDDADLVGAMCLR